MVCDGRVGGSGNGGKDVHSIEFYKLMTQAKADLDKDGKIAGEKEQSIFNKEIKNFDVDGKEGLTEDDVSVFKSRHTFSPSEKENLKSQGVMSKRVKILNFEGDIENTLQYLLDTAKKDGKVDKDKLNDFDEYYKSYKETYDEE